MRVWILGSGGREHAIGWAFKKCGHDVYFVPGNGGTKRTGENIPCKGVENAKKLIREREAEIDLLIPGSESYIAAGVADILEKKTFSPKKKPALLEASKIFAKKFMKKHGIRTARFKTVMSEAELEEALEEFLTFTYNSLYNLLRRLAKKAGVEGPFSPRAWRRL